MTMLATVADVKARLSGDVPTMSAAFDGVIAGCIAAVSAEIEREVMRARGYRAGSGWSFLAASANEVQTVILSTGQTPPTAGTFTLSFGGYTTTTLAYNIAAEDVEDALEALASIGIGNVSVSGPTYGPFLVTFGLTKSGPQALISGDASSILPVGSLITVVETVPAVASASVERFYRGRPGGTTILYIDDAVAVSAVKIYEPAGTLTQTLVVGSDVVTVPYQDLPITALELVNGFWPPNTKGIGVTMQRGFATEIPDDIGDDAIVESTRTLLGARAGYNDAIGVTPWGSVVTSKAFTDKTWATIRGYRLYGAGMR